MLRTQSDARLVDLVRAGHGAAFEAIVQRYRRPLLNYCARLLPASRAEDAVQQTFLKAYQAMLSGDAELNLRPWLYRIAHNASLNLLRQNGWSHEQLDESMDGVQRPDQAVELRERLRAAVSAVNALPERQRSAVLLREIEGLSYEQIALALGVGDGAVRQLLHRARATLRAGATAVTPVGLVQRMAEAATGGDPASRVAELTGRIGAGAGAIKVGAAVLATGVLATGAISGPLSHGSHGHVRHAAALSSARASGAGGPRVALDEGHGPGAGAHREQGSRRNGGRHGGSRSRHNSGTRHGSSRGGSGERRDRQGGSGERSGSRDGSERRSSGDSGGSGSDGGGDLTSGSDGGSSGDNLTSGSDSGSSGGDLTSGSDGGGGGGGLTVADGGGDTGASGGDGGGGSDGGQVATAPSGATGDSGSITQTSSGDGAGSTSGSSSGD